MPFVSNYTKSVCPIVKVTISPVKDTSGNTDKLLVTVKKMSDQNTDPKSSSPGNISKDSCFVKSTMTDKPKEVSCGSQATQEDSNPSSSVIDKTGSSVPCLRHAAQNISLKAADIPSEKINLCCNCSKSMLSYIFLVQDFLESLAKEIAGADSSECLQCARQELRNSLSSRVETFTNDAASGENIASASTRSQHSFDSRSREENKRSRVEERQDSKPSRQEEEGRYRHKRTSRAKTPHQNQKHEGISKSRFGPPATADRFVKVQQQQIDFLYNVSSPTVSQKYSSEAKPDQQSTSVGGDTGRSVPERSLLERFAPESTQNSTSHPEPHNITRSETDDMEQSKTPPNDNARLQQHYVYTHQGDGKEFYASSKNEAHDEQIASSPEKPAELKAENTSLSLPEVNNAHQQQAFVNSVPSPSLFSDEVDGIVSTLSNVEREVYDAARNRAGWESLTESQERLGSSSSGKIASEAFVTSCRNNAEALGCLVLGTSLLLTRTSRLLCVLVSDGVSTSFRGPLSSVFEVVQHVRSLDTLGTTKLALLEQPELGITFEKLNIWRLIQFNKCVYLNPDALVVQNCDELFCHEELSAVADIGWPDCFNSGVFVFAPSLNTFWQLLEFAEKQGSYDGGDQGLLNSYFSSWSYDINKKLSFIYNLMANVSYTYTPAFNQFGRNVKIVQFHGSFKPWHVKFFPGTGQISPSSPVHPTYVQFVHIWISIFRISVLRLMSKEIQSYAASQSVVCAVEILRFFPLPSESEAEFYLTPPSVRLRLAEKKLQRSISAQFSEAQRRKSAEFSHSSRPEDEEAEPDVVQRKLDFQDVSKLMPESLSKDPTPEEASQPVPGGSAEDSATVPAEKEEIVDENKLPGSEIGDYQGMKAWEQGRMDYQGTDSSENVIKRLEFLMSHSRI